MEPKDRIATRPSPSATRPSLLSQLWRKIVVSALVVVALAVVWVWPAFSEPPHRTAGCRERHWGYDALGRRWVCGDHWLIRIGDYGVLWV